jgi:hypothetical protein
MNKVLITLLTPVLLTGCMGGNPLKPAACSITVSSTAAVDQKAAANLTSFARRPATSNFRHDLASEYNNTFSPIRDSKTKCQMLRQLAACYGKKSEARKRVFELTEKTKVCE